MPAEQITRDINSSSSSSRSSGWDNVDVVKLSAVVVDSVRSTHAWSGNQLSDGSADHEVSRENNLLDTAQQHELSKTNQPGPPCVVLGRLAADISPINPGPHREVEGTVLACWVCDIVRISHRLRVKTSQQRYSDTKGSSSGHFSSSTWSNMWKSKAVKQKRQHSSFSICVFLLLRYSFSVVSLL